MRYKYETFRSLSVKGIRGNFVGIPTGFSLGMGIEIQFPRQSTETEMTCRPVRATKPRLLVSHDLVE